MAWLDRPVCWKFWLENEDALLGKANLKPMAGWGSWGRNSIFDPETGQMTSITDGVWLIFIGVYGWLGYIGRFGLLTAPILFYALRHRQLGVSLITPGLMMVLSANLIDLLPNAGLVNYVWLMAGSVAGHVVWRRADQTDGLADPSGSNAAPRADWFMPDPGPIPRKPPGALRAPGPGPLPARAPAAARGPGHAGHVRRPAVARSRPQPVQRAVRHVIPLERRGAPRAVG